MRTYIILSAILSLQLFGSCANSKEEKSNSNLQTQNSIEEAMLDQQQFTSLDMKVDSLYKKKLGAYVETNGRLEVLPQNKATVSTVIGGNILTIKVIQGDEVNKGDILAYVSHPEIISLQADYLNALEDLQYQQKEYTRQKRLYEEGVGSGETFQKVDSKLNTTKNKLAGLKSTLELLNINLSNLSADNIQQSIPITSPISGAIQEIYAKTGAYVESRSPLFDVLNTEHIHIDFMVFEKDISRIKVGQQITFKVESNPDEKLKAKIISIGKNFHQEPKAVNVHAEIIDQYDNLIPGMYVRGQIHLDDIQVYALPEDAIFSKGEKYYAFHAEREGSAWSFKPIAVEVGETINGWIPIHNADNLENHLLFAYNNAYYLEAEMSKGEGGHQH